MLSAQIRRDIEEELNVEYLDYSTQYKIECQYWRDFATLGKLCDLPWPYLIAHHMGENFPLVDDCF